VAGGGKKHLRVSGRAGHPWPAAVEQGCSTLPKTADASPTRPYPLQFLQPATWGRHPPPEAAKHQLYRDAVPTLPGDKGYCLANSPYGGVLEERKGR